MAEIKEVNDNITMADDIMASEHSAFVTKTASVCDKDFRTVANKDLVGEPLHKGIYDEVKKEVVKEDPDKKKEE